MTEPTPPPERPLPDEARARIRAELLAHAHDHRSAAPRWLVPAGAAAAVALVAGLGYWAISPGGSEPDGLPVTGGGDVDRAVAAGRRAELRAVRATAHPRRRSPTGATGAGRHPGLQRGAGERASRARTPRLSQVDGTSSFWVKGDRFVLCDELDGRTTVHQALPLTPREDVATYAVSTDFLDGQDHPGRRAASCPAGLRRRTTWPTPSPTATPSTPRRRPTTRAGPGGGWSTPTTTVAATR